MGLPRGATGQLETAPAATAQWASPAEISTRRYKPGALYLGMLPHVAAEAQPVLDRLAVFERALADAGDLKRPENAAWLAEKRRLLHAHRARLETTALTPIGVLDDRHILTVAGSRAGKGVSGIVPNLCWWPGSLVVIDPKGENARLTAARRGPGSACCEGLARLIHEGSGSVVASVA